LKASAKCVMSVDKEVVTLTFKSTELDDAGTYKCEASNKLGTVNTECALEVQSTLVFSLSSALFSVPSLILKRACRAPPPLGEQSARDISYMRLLAVYAVEHSLL